MKIDLLGGSYEAKYKELNSQKTINWYPVLSTTDEKDKSTTQLYPTPGLTTWVTLPGRYIRALYSPRTPDQNTCFAIIDTTLYEIFLNQSYVNRGSVANCAQGTTRIYMEANSADQLFICNYNAAYI